MEGLFLSCANYVPLSPISFLKRAAFVYGDRISIVYGATTFTWGETHNRCVKLASALKSLGVKSGDVVATVAPNVPALYELHFGVPMAEAVLSTLNTKLDEFVLASTLEQIEAKFVFVDYQHVESTLKALALIKLVKLPILVVIPEHDQTRETPPLYEELLPPGTLDYDQLLSIGDSEFEVTGPSDENCPISINFTSGSTGKPKGVVYSHRAVYLASIGQIFRTGLRPGSIFLWTVDMFRCNGWCFTWCMAALGGTNICIRSVTTKAMCDAITIHNITTICGPPSILKMIANCPLERVNTRVDVFVAGSLPPNNVLDKVEKMGFNVRHSYGMSEALGPVTTNNPSNEPRSVALEGIHNLMLEGVDVKDPITMVSVPRDGKTIGEVMFKGNTMMLGYLNNRELTKKAFQGGWYHTGDLGIRKLDGSIEMKDRALDVIKTEEGTVISLEVEAVLANHPRIDTVAVIGRPSDENGSQTPCAFVKLKEGYDLSEDEIISFCKKALPDFKVPRDIVFGDLPMVNGAGKVQKFMLRDKARKDLMFRN